MYNIRANFPSELRMAGRFRKRDLAATGLTLNGSYTLLCFLNYKVFYDQLCPDHQNLYHFIEEKKSSKIQVF